MWFREVMRSRNGIWFRKGIQNSSSVVQMGNVVQKSDRNRSSVVEVGEMKQEQRVVQKSDRKQRQCSSSRGHEIEATSDSNGERK
jgi:hypothetical protein